ncbi:MAG: hypothetical protein ABIN15_00830 [candidate division WOR-3 bacterium]
MFLRNNILEFLIVRGDTVEAKRIYADTLTVNASIFSFFKIYESNFNLCKFEGLFNFLVIENVTGIYLIMNISDFCSLLVGGIFLLKGKMTFGGYLAFVTAFWRSVTAVSQFFFTICPIKQKSYNNKQDI